MTFDFLGKKEEQGEMWDENFNDKNNDKYAS